MRWSAVPWGLMVLVPAGGAAEPPKGAPPGTRIDIGGRALHLVCAGDVVEIRLRRFRGAAGLGPEETIERVVR